MNATFAATEFRVCAVLDQGQPLFVAAVNTVLTLACVCLIVMIGIPLVNWLFVNAYWSGADTGGLPG